MRWRPIPKSVSNVVGACFGFALLPVAIVAFAPMIAGIWLTDKLFPGPPRYWHPWFAWRPVKTGHWADAERQWVWLERIERRSMPYDWPTEYRASITKNEEGGDRG